MNHCVTSNSITVIIKNLLTMATLSQKHYRSNIHSDTVWTGTVTDKYHNLIEISMKLLITAGLIITAKVKSFLEACCKKSTY